MSIYDLPFNKKGHTRSFFWLSPNFSTERKLAVSQPQLNNQLQLKTKVYTPMRSNVRTCMIWWERAPWCIVRALPLQSRALLVPLHISTGWRENLGAWDFKKRILGELTCRCQDGGHAPDLGCTLRLIFAFSYIPCVSWLLLLPGNNCFVT